MLTIQTSQIPADSCVGSYGPNSSTARPKLKHDQLKAAGSMPERALFLHPFAAASYVDVLHPAGVAVSDVYRSAESSLHAVATGRGALPPGFSLHNFGEAIDLRVADTMKRMRDRDIPIKTKRDLDLWMQAQGWYCHRTDHEMGPECWHYNAFLLFPALGLSALPAINPKKYLSTSGWAEELIKRMYRDQLFPDDLEAQTLLKRLGMYSGALDGIIGPQSKSAVAAFQRAWGAGKDEDGKVTYTLAQTGKLDDRTRRTIAFLASVKAVVPRPPVFKL